MLSLDDLKKLAEMQEKLLRIAINDRDVNLDRYKDIVKQIDEYYFSNLLSEIEQVSEHNQTLEDELQFLEQISSTYEQVLVEQVKFKNVCELYGDKNLELSDLSRIDKEYIDNRKNVISGYLINQKNIDDSKKKLDILSGQLRDEEKKNNLLKKRLLEFEETLRDNFINAEGRYLNDLDLKYVSVVSEYKDLGYDFKKLLGKPDELSDLLSGVYNDVHDADDKLNTAQMCYERIPSTESKSILDEISLENIRVKYRLTMLKILELLVKDYDNYDMFLKKRKDLFDLIKYRLDYVKKLGVNVSVDPFSRTKVFDQIKVVEVIEDNSKNIHKVRKEINELNGRLEEMVSMMNSYREELDKVSDIVVSTTSMNDIDISGVELNEDAKWDSDTYFEDKAIEEKVIEDNQIISVTGISSGFNMDIVSQKTSRVLKRVNEMINGILINEDKKNDVSPELVIEQVPVFIGDDVKSSDNKNDFEISDNMETENDELVDDSKNDDESFDINVFNSDNEDIMSDIISPVDVNDKQDDAFKFEMKDDDFNLEKNTVELPLFALPDDISLNNVFEDKTIEENVIENNQVVSEDVDLNIQDENEKDMVDEIEIEDKKEDQVVSVVDTNYDTDLFKTVDPFLETPLFTDRADENVDNETKFFDTNAGTKIDESVSGEGTINDEDVFFGKSLKKEDSDSNLESFQKDSIEDVVMGSLDNDLGNEIDSEEVDLLIDKIEENGNLELSKLDDKTEFENEMPDAFWTVQEEKDIIEDGMDGEDDNVVLSFDEQVELLRENNDIKEDSSLDKKKVKALKLGINNDIDKEAA